MQVGAFISGGVFSSGLQLFYDLAAFVGGPDAPLYMFVKMCPDPWRPCRFLALFEFVVAPFWLKSVARVATSSSETMVEALEQLWKGGRVGHLSPLEQVKAVVYRDVLKETGSPEHGLNTEPGRVSD